ncbi:ferredoxin [Micromonospora sp. NPDC049114]|uniref:ferredoxin n=1 Tax=unclassified Micromonospora TaxID=2617518 RepID=UPI001F1FEC35|nr:ferredoxin [Micromonospora sp. MH99]MCF0094641.1 Ferredoxin-2 [Micromonospora sp. MH99]
MRLVVDFSRCESNAVCVGQAPEVFDVGEDDRLHITEQPLEGSLANRVREAARRCPKQALSVVDD